MIYPDEDMKRWECCDTQVVLANANYYYTKGQVDKKLDEIDGMTEEEVQTMINRSIRTKADKTDVNTLSGQVENNTEAIANTYTKREVDNAITAATAPVNNTLTAHTANTSVHVTSQEKNYWNNKLDASAYTPTDLSNYYTKGQTNDLLDDKLDVTAYTPTDLSNYYTKQETQGVVNGAVSGKADTSAVTAVDDALTAHTSNANIHVTSQEKYNWNNKVGTDELNAAVSGKADTSAVTESISAAVSGKADTTYVNQVAAQATEAIGGLNTRIGTVETTLGGQIESLNASKFGYASYDSQTSRINFYSHDNSTNVLAYIDAADFIKDGMVSNVEIINGNLVITFNSDAGKQPISIPLTDIFNPSNYYTTGQTDALLTAKADTATTYTKTEVDTALGNKADTSAVTAVANDVSTVSGQVQTKVATSDFNTYTAATATALNGKADTSAVTTVSDALTAHTADTGVHVTSAEKTTWNNKSDFSGDYNDLTNKPTIPTIPTNISDFTNDAGYITNADIAGKADTSAVTAVNDALTAHTADTGVHVTSAEKTSWNSVSGKVETSAITSSITSSSTNSEVAGAKAVYDAIQANGGYLIDLDAIMQRGLTDAEWDGTIDAVTNERPVYIKVDGYWCTLQSYYLNGNEMTLLAASSNFASIYTVTKLGSNQYSLSAANKQYVSQAEKDAWNTVSGKADTSAVTTVSDALTAHTADTTVHVTSADKTSWNGAASNASDALTALGGLSLVSLTQAQYDALSTKDASTIYFING